MTVKEFYGLFKTTINEWLADKAPRLGAALAYYSMFSIAPLLIIAIGIAGLIFGQDAAEGQIVGQIGETVGTGVAEAVQGMVQSASSPRAGTIATIVGIVMLFFGASGVFGQLQDALNTIWKVAPRPGRGIKGFLKDRFWSFTMVLGIAFLLLVSLVLTTALEAISKFISPECLAGGLCLWQVVNALLSFVTITVLFGLTFKVLPDAKVAWRDVWVGAATTALLFTLGKYLIGLYLGRSSLTSAYGAAGSLVLVLVWIYYSAQIFLFGAEFTRVYAQYSGTRIEPTPNAVLLTEADRAREGIPSEEQLQRLAEHRTPVHAGS